MQETSNAQGHYQESSFAQTQLQNTSNAQGQHQETSFVQSQLKETFDAQALQAGDFYLFTTNINKAKFHFWSFNYLGSIGLVP